MPVASFVEWDSYERNWVARANFAHHPEGIVARAQRRAISNEAHAGERFRAVSMMGYRLESIKYTGRNYCKHCNFRFPK